MDRLLQRAVSTGMRRGLGGEPEWLAVALTATLVRRSIRRGQGLIWRGTVASGEQLVVKLLQRRASRAASSL